MRDEDCLQSVMKCVKRGLREEKRAKTVLCDVIKYREPCSGAEFSNSGCGISELILIYSTH